MRLSCTIFELLSLISQNLKTSRDLDHAHSRDSLYPNAKASHGEPVFEVFSFSPSRDTLGGSKKLNESCDHGITAPLLGVIFYLFGKT